MFCFNVKISHQVQSLAKQLGISIKHHKIIYKLLEDIKVCKFCQKFSSRILKPHIQLSAYVE